LLLLNSKKIHGLGRIPSPHVTTWVSIVVTEIILKILDVRLWWILILVVFFHEHKGVTNLLRFVLLLVLGEIHRS